MLIFIKTTMRAGEGVEGALRWLISFLIKTYKIETTVGDTVRLVPILKSVRTENREPEYPIWQRFS